MVSSIDDEDRASRLAAFVRGLKEIRPECTYFSAALLGSDAGWNLAFETCFAGFPEGGGPDKGVELREPVPVCPDRMTRLWEDAGQGWVVVNDRAQLIWLFRFGGNALIAEAIAREHLAKFVQPIEMIPNGAMGLRRFDPDAREAKRHRPRRLVSMWGCGGGGSGRWSVLGGRRAGFCVGCGAPVGVVGVSGRFGG